MLRVGAARMTITPPVGLDLSGWAFGPSVGVLDDLEAQALVLESDLTCAAVVTTDLIGLGGDIVSEVRRRIETSFGIPGNHILLSASHTHSGPATAFLRHWGDIDEGYARLLEAHLVGLVGMAQRDLCAARVGMAMGHAKNLGENRRVRGGPIDPAVPVLRFDDVTGRPKAVLYNFACHPVSLHGYGNLVTPDYPGYARWAVQQMLGQDTVVMFTLGAAGDINPLGFGLGQTKPQRSRQIGTILGCEVAKVALGLEAAEDVPLLVTRAVVDLPVEPLPATDELREWRDRYAAEVEKLSADGQRASNEPTIDEMERLAEIQRDWADEALQAWASGSIQRSRPCEVQAIRLGDAAIVALPLEVFVETGLSIKNSSPAQVTIVSSNSNGALGYLPTRHAYETEDDYTNPQGVAPKVYDLYAFSEGAEPLIRQTAAQLVESLFQEPGCIGNQPTRASAATGPSA